MTLPVFGQRHPKSKEYSIDEIPLFSALSAAEQKLIEKKARLSEYKRGDLVYSEGTPSEAFYIVITGRFRLFNQPGLGRPDETLLYFYRGDYFGETSLLTGNLHSASVEARSDGLLLKLGKEDFQKLVGEIPAMALHLSRTLGHRLSRRQDEGGLERKVKIAALYPMSASDKEFYFTMDLAAGLARDSKRKVILVDFGISYPALFRGIFGKDCPPDFDPSRFDSVRGPEMKNFLVDHPEGFQYLRVNARGAEDSTGKKISTLLAALTYRYDYLMLRLETGIRGGVVRALKQSDMVYVFCRLEAEALRECSQQLEIFQGEFGLRKNEIKVVVPAEVCVDSTVYEDSEKILGLRVFCLLPDRVNHPARYKSAMRFVTRELAEILVGVVLGSGAAYGLAHIGVLRVLEREGIPVDVIAGASIGALIGGLWGAGYSSDDLEHITRSIRGPQAFLKLIGFRDLALGHRGLLKGQKVTEFLRSYLGDRTFQDLAVPVKIVAVNLQTAQEIVFEAGRVVDAIRASISIPGIFHPFFYKGSHLIDGGVIDPLPVRVLTNMGVKKIIAVNVLPGPSYWEAHRARHEEAQQLFDEMPHRRMPWRHLAGNALERFKDRYTANFFNVIMSTILFSEFELATVAGRKADILVHPVVGQGHWAEFYSPEKFITMGEEKTREQLEDIKNLVAE